MVLTSKVGGDVSAPSNGGLCDEKTVEYLRDLIAEKQSILNFKQKKQTDEETNNSDSPPKTAGVETGAKSRQRPGDNKRNLVLRLLDQGRHDLIRNKTKSVAVGW